MKIGIYVGDYEPNSGGAYTFVAEFLDSLAEVASFSAHNFVLLCSPGTVSALKLKVEATNVVVVPVSPISWLARWPAGLKYYSPLFRWLWRSQSKIERVARRHNIQLLWYLGTGAYECPDMPYIATQWDLEHRVKPYFPELSANRVWDDREQYYWHFLRRATYCVTGTEVGKRQVEYMYQLAEKNVHVVPFPTPRFALNAPPSLIDVRSHFGISKDYVFYPAQFWPHKNHINLILALKWLKEHRGLEIALALSGSDKGNLSFVRNFAEQNGMADHVYFLGFVSREELIALYRQAVALTFVTYCGPDNLPPLEAFALGSPVIASATEGAWEQLGDAAVIVNPSNPEEIGQAVWDVYSNEELRAKLVDAGFKRAGTWTAIDYLNRMFRLFDEFSAVRRNWP